MPKIGPGKLQRGVNRRSEVVWLVRARDEPWLERLKDLGIRADPRSDHGCATRECLDRYHPEALETVRRQDEEVCGTVPATEHVFSLRAREQQALPESELVSQCAELRRKASLANEDEGRVPILETLLRAFRPVAPG